MAGNIDGESSQDEGVGQRRPRRSHVRNRRTVPEDSDDRFVLVGGRLTVRGRLEPGDERAYSEALSNLLATGAKTLTLDLRDLGYISSAFVGLICLLSLMARQNAQSVLVLAGKRVAKVLRELGVHELTEIHEAPQRGSQPPRRSRTGKPVRVPTHAHNRARPASERAW